MTILFLHHPYKYEIESVCKLFFQHALFQHEYESDDLDRDDLIVTQMEQQQTQTRLSASIQQNGVKLSECCMVDRTIEDYDQVCERMLATVLYQVLCKHTSIVPPWGIMTGIRPVKQYHYFLEKGKTPQEVDRIFTEDYFVQPQKLEICKKISKIQLPIIEASKPLSYSLYVSIPFCPSRCSYCSFVSSSIAAPKAKALVEEYLLRLCDELALIGQYAKEADLELETVYVGGGTPTTLSAEQLLVLFACLKEHFPLSTAKEFTVEAGRADTITADKLRVIHQAGATRISINPQTFSDEVLQTIGRKHSAREVVDCYHLAKKIGFTDINMDLIAGLPGDTLASFQASVDQAIALDPTNITVHTLTIKRSSDLFTEEAFAEHQVGSMVDYAYERLSDTGYLPYYLYRQKNTLDNLENIGYAKPGYEGLYNIYIMEEIHTILAAGAGAVSKLIRDKCQKVQRVFNYKYPFEYNRDFEEMQRRKQEIQSFYKNRANNR